MWRHSDDHLLLAAVDDQYQSPPPTTPSPLHNSRRSNLMTKLTVVLGARVSFALTLCQQTQFISCSLQPQSKSTLHSLFTPLPACIHAHGQSCYRHLCSFEKNIMFSFFSNKTKSVPVLERCIILVKRSQKDCVIPIFKTEYKKIYEKT